MPVHLYINFHEHFLSLEVVYVCRYHVHGQVGAGAFVRYSEVSFIGRFRHIIMFF